MSRILVMAGTLGAALLGATVRPAVAQLPRVAARASASPSGLTAVRGRVAGEDIIRTARRYLGVRYALGGTTPSAFDCSGFVQYVFAQHGIAMPRTAREQAGVGEAPFPGDLEPGDLLFFYGGQGAQHIAIYVGADSIIHASSGGRRVRVDRLSGSRGRPTWFRQRLIAVRRILPAEGYFLVPTQSQATLDQRETISPVETLVQALGSVPVVFE